MLKRAAFLTRPTPARQDAPFRGFVLSRMSPCDVPLRVRLSRPAPCGLAGRPFWTSCAIGFRNGPYFVLSRMSLRPRNFFKHDDRDL